MKLGEQATMKIEQRRICWPQFDATCLEGGCLYCNDHPFKNISTIQRAVLQGQGQARNRGNGAPANLETAFFWGLGNGWCNAQSRILTKKTKGSAPLRRKLGSQA